MLTKSDYVFLVQKASSEPWADGGDSKPPGEKAAKAAEAMICALYDAGAPPDRISPTADGTLMLVYSRGPGDQAWVEFERDGDFGGAVMRGGKKKETFSGDFSKAVAILSHFGKTVLLNSN